MEVTRPATNLNIIYSNRVNPQDEVQTLLAAIENPVDSPSFDTFMKGDQQILVLVNDGKRPTPTAKVLKILYPKLK